MLSSKLCRAVWLLAILVMLIPAGGCTLPVVNNPPRDSGTPTNPVSQASRNPLPSATASPRPALPTATATLLPSVTPLPAIIQEGLPITSQFLGNSRVLSIYLPPDYKIRTEVHFKVLYANDGQNLGLLGIEPYMYGLISRHELEQVIVVGIPASNDRENEYGTGAIKTAEGLGARSQAYNNFLIREVIPLINSKYRTLTGPQNTGIMGISLGGLSAFYLAWMRPDVFGLVGAFSGSFWWRTNINNLPELLASRVAQKAVRESLTKPPLRMWFSAGTAEFDQDRDKNGVIDMVQDTTDLIEELRKKGYQPGEDYLYVQIEGGTHDEATWAKVLPEFLRWSFPAP